MFDYEGSRREFLKLLAEFGEEPVFIARARAVQLSVESLLHNCQTKRKEMLEWPYRRISELEQVVQGNWRRIIPFLVLPEAVPELEAFHAEIPSGVLTKPAWSATEKGCLRQYVNSAKRFNRAWCAYLNSIDFESINRPRREYNQYYPVERACALGTDFVNDDFQPIEMLDIGFLESRFPYIPAPELI